MISSGPPCTPSFASKAVINLFCNYLLTYSSCCCRIEGKRRLHSPSEPALLRFPALLRTLPMPPPNTLDMVPGDFQRVGPVGSYPENTSLVLTQGRTRPLSQWSGRGQDWDKCPHSPAEHPQEVPPGRSHRALPRLHKCPSKSRSDFLPGAPGIWLRHPVLAGAGVQGALE